MKVSDQLYLVRTKQEAADLLDVSRQTVHKWEKDGPVAFYPVDHDWLVKHLPEEPELRRAFGQSSHAYVIGSIPRDIEVQRRLGRFRAVRVPPSSLPGYRADPDTRYSIRTAGVRLKLGYVQPGDASKQQKGFSRSYMYGIMGDDPLDLKSVKDGGRRIITEQAIRDYEAANSISEKNVLVRIFEPEDSEHWIDRTPEAEEKKSYSSPRVLYFKPFG